MKPAAAFWRCDACKTPNPSAAYIKTCLGCGASRPVDAARARRARPGLVQVLSVLFMLLVVAAWASLRYAERWVIPTAVMFMPRWLFLPPLLGLAVLAYRHRRRRLWLLHALTAGLVVGPLMGLRLGGLSAASGVGKTVTVMTLNLGQGPIDVARLARLIESNDVQVLCFQEKHPDPPLDDYLAKGWFRDRREAIFSRLPIVREWDPAEGPWDEYGNWPARVSRVLLRTPDRRPLAVASVHLPTMRYGFAKLSRLDLAGFRRYLGWRWTQARALRSRLDEMGEYPTLVGGDLNMPADSPMMSTLQPHFRSAYRDRGVGHGYTRPSTVPWAGIDHLLRGPGLSTIRAEVGPPVGSDHRPLIAVFRLPDGPR